LLASSSPPAPPETLDADAPSVRPGKSAPQDAESGLVARQRLLRVTQRDRLEEIATPPGPAPVTNARASGDSEVELDAALGVLLSKKLGLTYDEIREVIVRRKDGRSIRLRPSRTNSPRADVLPRDATPSDEREPQTWAYAAKKK
jgi:hypothetical protein